MKSSSAFCCASISRAWSRRRDSSASVMALKSNRYSLETPNDLPGYAREIALMREMAEA